MKLLTDGIFNLECQADSPVPKEIRAMVAQSVGRWIQGAASQEVTQAAQRLNAQLLQFSPSQIVGDIAARLAADVAPVELRLLTNRRIK